MHLLDLVPLIFRTQLVLFCLVGHAAVFTLNHVADVDFVYQHIGNCVILPNAYCFSTLVVGNAIRADAYIPLDYVYLCH